jgi:6-pyruvoyltetrahydropterin/6-carboxytetrahydropterin synthase
MAGSTLSSLVLSATSQFSAAHFYHRPEWSVEKNQAVFGACFSVYGHGHDYKVQAWVETSLEQQESSMERVKAALDQVCSAWDHKHLNFDIEDFRERIPTSEEISRVLWAKLRLVEPGLDWQRLRVYERPDLWAELVV